MRGDSRSEQTKYAYLRPVVCAELVEVELPTYDQKVANLEEKQQELAAHPHVAQQLKDGAAADWAEFHPRWGQFNDDLAAKRDRYAPELHLHESQFFAF